MTLPLPPLLVGAVLLALAGPVLLALGVRRRQESARTRHPPDPVRRSRSATTRVTLARGLAQPRTIGALFLVVGAA